MQRAISQFRDSYAEQFAAGVQTLFNPHWDYIINQIHMALERSRSTIYLFGNGGSHAICQCLKYALQNYALANKLTLRVQTGVDVHKLAFRRNDDAPGISFEEILQIEGANQNDLLILVSGSGNSDNIIAAASYANQNSIPTLAFIGDAQGRLRDFILPKHCFSAELEDQQISEDVIQAFAFLLHAASDSKGDRKGLELITYYTEKLKTAIAQIPASFICRISDKVIESFFKREVVNIIGLDHPALSACAEHTAHNLYWDGIYQVANPPHRLIYSSPTACDFSGISNDRRYNIIDTLTGTETSSNQGTTVYYCLSIETDWLSELNNNSKLVISSKFFYCSDDKYVSPQMRDNTYSTGLTAPQLHASAAQIFGHILGRVVRLKLIESIADPKHIPIGNKSRFLIDCDLAQRRLLNAQISNAPRY